MRDIISLDFPLAEYEARISGLFAKLNETKCDAVLLNNNENLRYFSNYQSTVWDIGYEYPAMLIATRTGKLALVTSTRRRPTAEAICCLDIADIYDYEGFGEAASPEVCVPALLDVLKKLGITTGKLGTETGAGLRMRISYRDYQELFNSTNGLQQVDFLEHVLSMRAIKSESEVAIMRKCCDIATKCFANAMEKLELGVTTEEQFYHDYTLACFDMGADDMQDYLMVEFGPDRGQINCMPSSKVYENPDWCVFIDGGPALKGYTSDIVRIGKLTQPRPEQAKLYDLLYECHRVCIPKVKPGYKISALSKASDDFMYANNTADICVTMTRGGHGIGLDVHEPPFINIGSTETLKVGMVFSFEPVFIHPTEGMFTVEDNYVVTETGCECLSPALQERIYVPEKKPTNQEKKAR